MSEKKVLIVDYDKKSIATLENLLSSYNLQIIKASDGQEAYQKILEEKPDLVLLEPMVPKLHGFDLIRKIRGESGNDITVVIITGLYKGSQYRNEAINSLGVAEYLEKPYNDEQLLNTVLNLVFDEVPVEEDLPDPDAVTRILSEMADKVSDKQEGEMEE